MDTPSLLSDRYQLGRLIGTGSTSKVFEAVDTKHGSPVAVKLLRYRTGTDKQDRIWYLRKEVDILAQLRHPHIVEFHEVGCHQNDYYLVMELLEGMNLAEYLKSRTGPFDPAEAVELVIQIAEALECAHDLGIIHRDIKPSNIMVLPQRGMFAKVLDFGLSCVVTLVDRFEVASQAVVGTFAYAAPEQTWILRVPVDCRADLYALGVLFYQLLAGALPFDGTDPHTLMHQHIAIRPPSLRYRDHNIPEQLEAIVMKLLEKEPRRRYQSAAGLIADLRKYKKLSSTTGPLDGFVPGEAEQVRESVSFHTRVVGRESVTEMLEKAFAQALKKGDRKLMILVKGKAGIGKTRLVDELRGNICKDRGLFISGKCHEYTRDVPYAPFVESVKEYIQQFEGLAADKQAALKRGLEKKIGKLGGEIARIVPGVKQLIGESEPLVTSTMEQDREEERFLHVASDFLAGLASEDWPVLMFWDDLQWSDKGSLKLLERLLPKVADCPLLIVGAYREEEVDPKHPLSSFKDRWSSSITQIQLSALNPQGVTMLLADLLNAPEADVGEHADWVYQKTLGNPFFTLEMVRILLDQHILSFDGSRWNLDRERGSEIALSQKVDEVILRRLATLGEESRDILRFAAIIGRHFTFDDIHLLSGAQPEQIMRSLDEALRKELVRPQHIAAGESDYTFAHDKILETLYESIEPSERRQQLHQKLGQSLEEHYRNRITDVIFELALHFTRAVLPQEARDKSVDATEIATEVRKYLHQAADTAGAAEIATKALSYSRKAADTAKATYANKEAAHHYETVLGLIEAGVTLSGQDTARESVRIKLSLADVCCLLGRYEDAITFYFHVRDAFNDRIEKSRVETKIGTVFFRQGNTDKTLEHFHNGLAVLGIRQPRTTSGVILSILTESIVQTAHTYLPRLFVRTKTASPAPRDLERDPEVEAIRLFELLIYYYYFIDMKRCFQVHMKQLNLAERIGSEALCRIAYSLHELLCNAAGMHRRALRYAMKAFDLSARNRGSQKAGEGSLAGIGDNALLAVGRAYYYMAEWDHAIKYLNDAAKETKRLGNLWETEVAYGHLCIALLGQGRFQEIDYFAKELLNIAKGVHDTRGMGWGHVLFALYYAHLGELGNLDRATYHAEQAVKFCKQAKDHLVTAMSLRVLGLICLKARDLDKAIEVLEESREIIERNQILHDFITGTYVILSDTYIESALAHESLRLAYLRKARKPVFVALALGRLFKNWQAYAYRVKAKYEWERGRRRRGISYFKKSIAIAQNLGACYEEAQAYFELGKRLSKLSGNSVREGQGQSSQQ